MVLFVGAAFAADGVVPSRIIPGTAIKSGTDSENTENATSAVRADGRGGAVASRTAVRTTQTVARTPAASESVKSDTGVVSRSAASASRNGGGTNVRKQTDINSNSAVRRAGVVLRPSVAEFGGRAVIAGTNQQTGSNIASEIRKVTNRAAVNKESIAEAKGILEETAELNKSCQQQYNECMDQFCAIVDTNQKRCSCSANLSKYKKVEEAVNSANTKLNEVAQNIRYVGLSADEIRAIMTATEAEEALSGTRDNTENRNMLERIESMIKDPVASTSVYESSTDFGLDMNLDFTSTTDMFNLDFLSNNTGSFSNLRGTELYNAARSRCSTILTQCRKAGATVNQVTGNYDLAIDKDCIAYESGLKKLNENLVSNVRSAERMLQKARLAVLQNKNQYDAKGCIGALEACMVDDMVCGEDYVKCVDPTKKYIDENGEVVLGQNIASITQFMKDYDNAAVDDAFLQTAYGTEIGSSCPSDGSCTVKYLLQKIGMGQKVTDGGLCRAVLDKCQVYTYKDSTYQPYNSVIINYIQRAMVNIKASQAKIISDYASSCMTDVAACYNQQVTQVNAWTTSASTENVYNIMNGACRSVALTCGLAIFVGDPEIANISLTIDQQSYTAHSCTEANGKSGAELNSAIIGCVSEIFYQSLLCPDNSTYDKNATSDTAVDANGVTGGHVNNRCKCQANFDVWNGQCITTCASGYGHDSMSGLCKQCDTHATSTSNICKCNTGYTGNGFTCTASGS